jgi:redox-sensitive bicupin YhaK (pirin superfamily)
MIEVRRAAERGHAQHGWLESAHSFSFAAYHDPRHMGFRSLRVINEDRVEPGKGFDTHSHSDMEIISYVLEGALEHADSMQNGSVIRPGDVQLMRAGTGVTHSEYNHSHKEQVHFLQIWILPDELGLEPAYEQRHFPIESRRNQLRLAASRDGRDDSIRIHQDADLYLAILDAQASVRHPLPDERYAWIQMARGAATVNGQALGAGDGAAVHRESTIELVSDEGAELLLFDLG